MRGNSPAMAAVVLAWVSTGLYAQPDHDNCHGAITIVDDEPYVGSSDGATGSDLSSCGRDDTRDVWHVWRPDCSGLGRVSLCGSGFDTVMAVFDGCGGAELACNDDTIDGCAQENRSVIKDFPVIRRTRYWIRVSGREEVTGDYALTATCTELGYGACCLPDGTCAVMTGEACADDGGRFLVDESCEGLDCSLPQPPHDLCDKARPTRSGRTVRGSSWNATGHGLAECGEDARDVWHVWTCDCPEAVEITLCGSAFDTTLTIYDACGGAELACDNDDPDCRTESSSTIRGFVGTIGTDYLLRVAGDNGESGEYELLITCPGQRRHGGGGEYQRPRSARRIR